VSSTALHILIAEDEFTHVFAMRRILEKKLPDARIEVVGSIREYQNSIAAVSPTIVLLDLNLTDGCTLDMLKAASAPPPFPVIMLSSYAGKQVAEEAVQAGAVDFIIKSADLFASIADIVEKTVREWGVHHEINSDQ
jgi:DNA-binding NtrC family response regulator